MSATTIRRKPGPAPKDGPKAKSASYSLYPIDEAAIARWTSHWGTPSEAAALRRMIDVAMSLQLGSDWQDKIGQGA